MSQRRGSSGSGDMGRTAGSGGARVHPGHRASNSHDFEFQGGSSRQPFGLASGVPQASGSGSGGYHQGVAGSGGAKGPHVGPTVQALRQGTGRSGSPGVRRSGDPGQGQGQGKASGVPEEGWEGAGSEGAGEGDRDVRVGAGASGLSGDGKSRGTPQDGHWGGGHKSESLGDGGRGSGSNETRPAMSQSLSQGQGQGLGLGGRGSSAEVRLPQSQSQGARGGSPAGGPVMTKQVRQPLLSLSPLAPGIE